MSLGTLRGWLKTASRNKAALASPYGLPSDVPAPQWSTPQRLLALQENQLTHRGRLGRRWFRNFLDAA